MIKLFPRIASNRGDTIVEVLIAIAVVSLVLAGAFVSSNRSLKATRTAQERGEALKLAESQVEQIKLAADNKTLDVFGVSNFCIGASPYTSPPCTSSAGVAYKTTVIHTSGSHDFVVQVTWDALAGGTNNVELDYRAQ